VPDPGHVYGMDGGPADPDWPPLTDDEVTAILPPGTEPGGPAAAAAGESAPAARAVICWRSPRPWSAAGLVSWHGRVILVKRHHVAVRTAGQLVAEHAFAAHLRGRGIRVPAQVMLAGGRTVRQAGSFVYEAQERAAGVDAYRAAVSWSPYASSGHARSAGATLARLHQAAASFAGPARAPGVLLGSCAVVLAPDPLGRLEQIMARRPGLLRSLAPRRWRADVAGELLPALERAGTLGRPLPRQWGHGDWHPSNLGWTGDGPAAQVASVFDFGLANRTFAVHDLATAIERSTVGWLELAGSGRASVDIASLDTLLDGYESVRPLTPAEAAALVALLPVVHVELALSELEYFADVVHSPANADLAYDGYLLGHARWFASPAGQALLGYLAARRRSATAPG
jgi:Ser/Thr protein kinase RdoA (MazF antagonist)